MVIIIQVGMYCLGYVYSTSRPRERVNLAALPTLNSGERQSPHARPSRAGPTVAAWRRGLSHLARLGTLVHDTSPSRAA